MVFVSSNDGMVSDGLSVAIWKYSVLVDDEVFNKQVSRLLLRLLAMLATWLKVC